VRVVEGMLVVKRLDRKKAANGLCAFIIFSDEQR